MKIREKLLQMLVEHGLFEDQASQVLDNYLESEMGEPMKNRMNDNISDYPDTVFVITWVGVKATALRWIDENKPQHWARGLFV